MGGGGLGLGLGLGQLKSLCYTACHDMICLPVYAITCNTSNSDAPRVAKSFAICFITLSGYESGLIREPTIGLWRVRACVRCGACVAVRAVRACVRACVRVETLIVHPKKKKRSKERRHQRTAHHFIVRGSTGSYQWTSRPGCPALPAACCAFQNAASAFRSADSDGLIVSRKEISTSV